MPNVQQNSLLVFYVNGRKVEDRNVDPKWTLLEYLRNQLRLCGTKLGCGEGGCGACTVMVSRFDRIKKCVEHISVNACLAPVASVHGMAVTTVEGIGSTKTKLHPVQERMFKSHGSQCGFCTPGIVMSMYTLLRQTPTPTFSQMQNAFQGNLCRCTGYRPIIQGLKGLTDLGSGGCCKQNGSNGSNGCCKQNNSNGSNGCCKQNGSNGTNDCCKLEDETMSNELYDQSEFRDYDPSQEPIFPPELQLTSEYDDQLLRIEKNGVVWYRPTSLDQLLLLKAKYPEAKMPVGSTEISVEVKLKYCNYGVLIAINGVPELNIIEKTPLGIRFGAATPLSVVENVLKNTVQQEPEHKTRVYTSILYMLELFAGSQIRNVACIGGNLATASPISDLNPILMACGAQVELASANSRRTIILDHTFFRGYRRTSLNDREVIVSITIPFTAKNEYFAAFKQSQRREDDIAIVNSAMRVILEPDKSIIQDIYLAYGGVAPITMRASRTMDAIKGRHWDEAMLQDACQCLSTEFELDESTPGGMYQFRQTLVLSFFFKFYLGVLMRLEQQTQQSGTRVPDSYVSACSPFHSDPPKATQLYQLVAPGQRAEDPIGRPVPHYTGAQQVCGEAVYCDDMAPITGELFMAHVLSTKAHAKILSIDAEPALAIPGVEAYIGADDLDSKRNCTGTLTKDEQVFASEKVTCQGQVIGVVLAEDKDTARKAARAVRIEYEPLPVILSIEDAIKANSFYPDCHRTIISGDPDKAMQEADHVLEGEMKIGGQNHFYLEPNSGRAVPKGEHGEMEITISSQTPNHFQMKCAEVLNIPANRIVVKVKRLGGGFGGKETRTTIVALPIAVAANKLGRPVRFCLDRDEDMQVIGGRHPFLIRYKVGFTSDGHLLSLIAQLYCNGGHVLDLSGVVLDTALTKLDCAYRLPNVHLTGSLCKTNVQTNTAFRGFGAPQVIVWIEAMMDDIANYLEADPVKIREINMYEEGDKAFYGQVLSYCTLGRCWRECYQSSDFRFRKEACQQFNRENKWKKRGISINPLKYGMGYPIKPLNQGTALVHIYVDGSVLVTHGGVEMGQGLHVKMIQVASRALRIPSSKIHISETSTDKTPNATQTAASFSSDLFGRAVQNACQTLLERLEPIMDSLPKGTWEDWINTAYKERVNLSVAGHYKAENCNEMDFEKMSGEPYQYFSYGAACSEVELDVLTGDHRVIRTDIVMDVGESLNPAIDIGQIEGAFMQGYGLYTIEQMRYSPEGTLYTRGPGTYKIPGFDDIPNVLNVALLKGSPNIHAIYSSKGIGEPPLLLASSVYMAIKDAIAAARMDEGIRTNFRLDTPATAEKIRMSCGDRFATQIQKSSKDGEKKKPWEIFV